jgi:transaldolase
MRLKLFLDGADIQQMIESSKNPQISGFTTNPTLMKKSGVSDYELFAREAIESIKDKSISFEVFSDELDEMYKEAKVIKSWGGLTYVKIPAMNTKGEPTYDLIKTLSDEGVPLNITAVFTLDQVSNIYNSLNNNVESIISIFAGRIADTGIDPVPVMKEAKKIISPNKKCELLWASPREALNIIQAEECGCDIITATNDLIKKSLIFGKDLEEFSRETVLMFYNDAKTAGYKLI